MWWGTPAEKAGTTGPAVGAAQEESTVAMDNMTHTQSMINNGIRNLFINKELCDVAFVVKDQRFMAHQSVLAALSTSFCKYLAAPHEADQNIQNALVHAKGTPPSATTVGDPIVNGALSEVIAGSDKQAPAAFSTQVATNEKDNSPNEVIPADPMGPPKQGEVPATRAQTSEDGDAPDSVAPKENSISSPTAKDIETLELQVKGIETTEAMGIMLEYMYYVGTGAAWEYSPSSMTVNKDILRLARIFGLQSLHERAARWIAQGLTSANVVERLVACEEHDLGVLRQKIMTELTANPMELATISRSPEITQHPRILQDLLMQMTSLCTAPGKKGLPKEAEIPSEKQVEKPTEKPAEKEKPAKRARKGA